MRTVKAFYGASFLSLLTSVVSYFILIYITRQFDKETVGTYLYILSVSIVLMLVLDYVSEQCSTHFSRVIGATIEDLVLTLLTMRVLLVALGYIIVVVLDIENSYEYISFVFFFLIPTFYVSSIFEFHKKNHIFASILLFERIVFFCILLLATHLLASDNEPSLRLVAIAFFISTLTCSAIQFFLVLRQSNNRLPSFVNLNKLLRYFGSYWPIYLVSILQSTYGHYSRWVVEYYFGLVAFASMSIALSLVNLFFIVQKQADKHFRQLVFDVGTKNTDREYRGIVRQYFLYFIAPLILAIVFTNLSSEQLIALVFGKKWDEVYKYLNILVFMIVPVALLRLSDIFVIRYQIGLRSLYLNTFVFIVFSVFSYTYAKDISSLDFCIALVIIQYSHAICQLSWVIFSIGRLRKSDRLKQ